MKRAIETDLMNWKEGLQRKPLLIRGARQVGKTFIIRRFGHSAFESMVEVNFEEMRTVKNAFEGDLTPAVILRDLSSRLNVEIIPGRTLLFFDEIQACPNALLSLRFFYEKMPELHVIVAGSLLEFVLGDGPFSFPVGRVDVFFMRPMSFMEYLEAKGNLRVVSAIREAVPGDSVGSATHAELVRSVREYFIVGGMPEAVRRFLSGVQLSALEPIHHHLLNVYENDLGKYPKSSQVKFMKLLFEAAPRLVAEHFKYAKIHPHAQSRDYLEAIQVLSNSGILHRVFATSASGVPLEAQSNTKKFKLLFLDIGLLPHSIQQICDVDDLTYVNRGSLAEQFVGQELLAYQKPYMRSLLYYWEREKRGSEAEVDYIVEVGGGVFPVEVKAGVQGSLRSLKQFMMEKRSVLGVRIDLRALALRDHILTVPFYMISELSRLIEWSMQR